MYKNIDYCYPEGKIKALTMSYDAGSIHDRRLIEIFNRHSIKGSFHIYTGSLGKSDTVSVEEVSSLYAGHEVSCHTETHPFLERVPGMEITRQIMYNKERLEQLCGYVVRGLSYPYGTYDDRTIKIASSLGIRYARRGRNKNWFAVPSDFMTWEPTCHHKDGIADKLERFKKTTLPMSLFCVWGHSYEFENDGNWDVIENFCAAAESLDSTWFATCIEICDYINAMRCCEMSSDRSMLYNPSAISVWVAVDGKPIECRGGACTRLF